MPRSILLILGCILTSTSLLNSDRPAQANNPFGANADTVLFLGDSNTFAGQYIAMVEAQLRATPNVTCPTLLNLGLPSETCSGLSEPIHPFPRPNVHERLDRALSKIKPDVVFVCYGTNDGIYAPFSADRMKAYQDGIRTLVSKILATGATCYLCTPAPFDPLPMQKSNRLASANADSFSWKSIYENYDDVLAKYSQWLQDEYKHHDRVHLVDYRTSMLKHFENRRRESPDYVMSGDGIHFNADGHRVLADTILHKLGVPADKLASPKSLQTITKKQTLLRDAWLSEVGHLRPGVTAGLPIDEALQKDEELSQSLTQP